MRGFWSNKTPREKIIGGAFKASSSADPCERCKLYKDVHTPRMPYSGEGRKEILAIGEAPGKTEDIQGIQFVGDAGKLWQQYLNKYEVDIHEDLWLINSVNCRPPNNRTPTKVEISCCKPMITRTIEQLKPKFIWLVGGSAIQSFYGGRFSDLEVGIWHKLCIPDPGTNAWVIPMYHPSFALRAGSDLNKTSAFERDLSFACSCLNKRPPIFPDVDKHIRILTEFRDVIWYLRSILNMDGDNLRITFDYETSNKKPYYGDVQKIWSCSICDSGTEISTAFPIEYTGHFSATQIEAVKLLLRKILLRRSIQKIAHNLQFEDLWSRVILDCKILSWHWCTMNAAHVLDCRPKYTKLKFQGYINFGIEGYEQETYPLMQKFHKGTRLNLLDTLPLYKLLRYNAIDSLITWWLYKRQARLLLNPKESRGRAYRDLTKPGLLALNDATITGIGMDRQHYIDEKTSLSKRLRQLERILLQGKVADEFKELTGKPLGIVNKDFRAKDLRTVLYEIIKVNKVIETATGMKAVNKDIVTSVDHKWTKALIEWRQINKITGTYIAQFEREIDTNGRMHPSFTLHIARTYRSSSKDPNFQNIPNRDKDAKAATRKGIIPSKGRRIATVDLGSHEVRVAAILSQDPKLMWYCSQSDSDMHLDVATRIWDVDKELVTKEIRFHSKSGFVFAEFYGSYYVNCAVNMWEWCADLKLKDGTSLRKHLKEVGILSGSSKGMTKMKIRGRIQTISTHLAQLIDHMKEVEKWFWEEFSALREWQFNLIDTYQRKGWVEMPFGFKRNDLMGNNEVINSSIQGTAFHILLWLFIEMNKICKRDFESDVCGQIHDEIVFDLCDHELQDILNISERLVTKDIVKAHPWINVPLIAEPEVTEIDESWFYKKEMIKNANTGLWGYKE